MLGRVSKGAKLKVSMVSYSFYEGDNRVRRYAETLAARGDHVDVIALRLEDQSRYEEICGVHVYRIQRRTVNEKGKLTYAWKLALFFFQSMAFLTYKHLRNSYDLIHVHSVPDFEVFAAWFPKLTGAKVILDIHDIVPEFYMSKFGTRPGSLGVRILLFLERISTAFADHVIISNHLWRDTLLSRCLVDRKCSPIVNFPDPLIFRRGSRTRADNKFIMVYPGTLNYHQGVDLAVRAFASVKEQMPEAEFHIYGAGPGKPEILKLIEELGLAGRVRMKDRVPLHVVASVIENADLGVVPKRGESFGNEAFSTKILEFMALGVPVLVSDTKIDRYYFKDTEVQFFKSGDQEDLAKNMLRLVRDSGLREQLVRNSGEFIRENNWGVKKDLYLKVVEALVAGGKSVPDAA